MSVVRLMTAWGFGCWFLACGGTSHRLGGEPDGGTSEGGTAGTTSSSGGQSDSGGTGSMAGTSSGGGTSGTAGSGTTGCEQPLDLSSFGCDVSLVMRQHCARAGCHNATTRSADLDLTMDSLLIARLLDVPARLVGSKPGVGACRPTTCPPLGSVMLIDSAQPEMSWMLTKTAAFDVTSPTIAPDIGCGTAMPYPPGGTGYTPERDACLASFIVAIAQMGTPCSLPREPLELPDCPEE